MTVLGCLAYGCNNRSEQYKRVLSQFNPCRNGRLVVYIGSTLQQYIRKTKTSSTCAVITLCYGLLQIPNICVQ